MTSPLLSMRDVAKRFGATRALRGVSLELAAGEVLALIGENGAGKSTLMKILSGAITPDSGAMSLAGQPYAPSGPADARRAGVAIVYQELSLAPHLSVADNVMLGQERRRWGLLDRHTQESKVRRVLDRLGHPDLHPDVPVYRLSSGARQLVEIARALALDARLIVFDEPTSSLSKRDAEHLFVVIDRLRQNGLGIIYISHFLEEIRRVCDRYTVLRDGESVGQGKLADVTEQQIVTQMVGRTVDDLFPQVAHQPGDTLLEIDKLSGRRQPRGVSIALRRGEVLGIAGLVGAGRTELLRALFGLDAIREGNVRLAGNRLSGGPQARIKAGLGMVAEDRKGEGLAQILSIEDNLTLSRLSPYSRWGWLNMARRRRAVTHWMTRFRIKAQSPEQEVAALSGGNQQKVAIARVMHQDADVYLLDEPTRGIDVGTKSEIYRWMGELAAAGKAVIFVSSYLPELLAVCDRIGVMARGSLREVRPRGDWTEESLMTCAVGSDD